MPVAYPPPLPPVPVAAQQVRNPRGGFVIALHGYRLHVFGAGAPEGDVVVAALQQARSLSDAVQRISYLVYSEGRLSTQVRYALVGKDLYVMCLPRPIGSVRGLPAIRAYFTGLADDSPMTADRFESMRVLASVHSERAGIDVAPRFVEGPSGQLILDLGTLSGPSPQQELQMRVSNAGNRFIGEKLVDAEVNLRTAGGSEFRALGRTAPSAINGSDVQGSYAEGTVSVTGVSPLGIYGVSARGLRFTQEAAKLTGNLLDTSINWGGILSASSDDRLLTQLRVGYINRTSTVDNASGYAFRESYAVGELGGAYSRVLHGVNHELRSEISISAVAGRPTGGETISPAKLDFALARPALRLETGDGAISRYGISASMQLAGDLLPEQQQWSLGGPDTLTGFAPGALLGDRGGLYRLYADHRLWEAWQWRMRAEGFAEYGQSQSNAAAASDSVKASDLGIGLRLQYRQNFEVRALAARPMSYSPALETMRAQAFITVTTRF